MTKPKAGTSPRSLPTAELLWKSLTASIDCFVTVIDPDYRIQYINHIEEGLATAEAIGRDVLDFIEPAERDRVRQSLAEVFTTGRTIAYEVLGTSATSSPSRYSVRLSPVQDDGRIIAVVSTALDQRELLSTESSLRTERLALRQLIKTQERERQLISYDIHDGLAQYQNGAIMELEACLHRISVLRDSRLQDVEESCREGLRLIRAAAAESLRLINGLRPPMLDELGIIEAIESLVVRARDEIHEVDYERPATLDRLDPDVETTIFRIAQEALSNVRKHSGAKKVRVLLERRGEQDIALIVTDDGIGYDVKKVPEDRFGLEGIRQRAHLFGREAVITSAPDKGSSIEVVLPLVPK
jgi:hypothetical protein